MGVWYTTREYVARALDSADTAIRRSAQIDAAIESASRSVEALCHRTFYPQNATRTFDWPNEQQYGERPWRLWLNQHNLISVSALVSGGVTIPSTDYLLRPDDGPPFTRLELDLDSDATFTGADTHQRAISITGVWGGCALDEVAAGALSAAMADTAGTVADVDGPAAASLGVGNIVRVDTERMLITGRTMTATGQVLSGSITASNASAAVAVANGALFALGEVILLDTERMYIVDIAGNTLIVRRAWDGTALAAHTASAVYASRRLTVQRGALGTTAATHLSAAPVLRFDPPALVRQLAAAEAITTLQQELSAYARTVGAGDSEREASGKGIKDLRMQVYTAHGRKARLRGV